MARDVNEIPQETDTITGEQLRALLNEVEKWANDEREAKQEKDAILNNGIEQYGLNRTAMSFVRKLDKMDDLRRQDILRNVYRMCKMLGHFDQADAFNNAEGEIIDAMAGNG